MFKNNISCKEFKRVANLTLERLRYNGKNHELDYDQVLEGLSVGFGYRDWNTLSAALDANTPAIQSDRNIIPKCKADLQLVIAPAGWGKSILLNNQSMEHCLSELERTGKLPLVSIVDVGGSASGFISLLKENLKPEHHDKILSLKLKMKLDHAINPFDLPLGFRKPGDQHRFFLINFIALLTLQGKKEPASGMLDLIGMVVDEAYSAFSGASRYPKVRMWREGVNLRVDEFLKKHCINADDMSWYEISDLCFLRDDFKTAEIAHQQAVPKLEDLMAIRTASIMDIYATARIDNNESLLDLFWRTISSALRQYPVLGGPTKLDTKGARVICMDTSEVSPHGTGVNEKSTAIMYLLVQNFLCKSITDVNLNDSSVFMENFKDRYVSYHTQQNLKLSHTSNRLVCDEFHRAQLFEPVLKVAENVMKQAYRQKTNIVFATQTPNGISREMVRLATSILYYSINTYLGAQHYKLLGIPVDHRNHILQFPSVNNGSSFLHKRTVAGEILFSVEKFKIDVEKLWAYNTNVMDQALLKKLSEKIGSIRARALLTRIFPMGSAKTFIENRIFERSRDDSIMYADNNGVICRIVDELVCNQNLKVLKH